ncbi:hypothetical protein F5146DRAFT_1135917 [Armillaria mellea]|nr:hypothetical protein F5146DRAFT_1135917 [Armillaria mellea]
MSESYTYTIQSVETGYYVTSSPEWRVGTVDGKDGIPAGATLTFNKALEPGNNIDVTIKGINGKYAARTMHLPFPDPVVWSPEAENWQIQLTSTPEVYVIIPKGRDQYWYTNETYRGVALKAGSGVVRNENKWIIKKVD